MFRRSANKSARKRRETYGVIKEKSKAPRNKTISLTDEERESLSERLIALDKKIELQKVLNKTINQDFLTAVQYLPDNIIDLLILDPPYNLNKNFGIVDFKKIGLEEYAELLDQWLLKLLRLLKPSASIYICGDWRSSTSIHLVARKYFNVLNRITWEREKGRGAKLNWKNNSEDIWHCANSQNYVFNLDAVKLKRKVIAPYTKENGEPKDWIKDKEGGFRLTHPSNIWTDISVPFWSMPENTEHPTQKPEKLIAKLILASSNEGDVVFDPFLGSGTTSVAAKKLNRNYIGIEINREYALITEKRLLQAKKGDSIQGYSGGVFWERNALAFVKKKT